MPTIEFNAQTQNRIKATDKFVEYTASNFDSGYSGSLCLRVSPKDKRTWFIRYRSGKKTMKYTIGQYPDMSYSEAKQVATDKLKAIAEGGDPSYERKQRVAAPTVAELWALYQEKLADRARPKADSTMKEEARMWSKDIEPAIGHLKVEDVKPVDLSDLLRSVVKRGPVIGNRVHSLLQVMFKPALANGWIDAHPLHWIDKPAGQEAPRKRFLSDDEIAALWPHFESIKGNGPDILKVLLYTAQRSGEVHSMRWSDIDLDQGIWTVPDTKTGNDHLVPLSDQVLEILKGRDMNSSYVFPSTYNRSRDGYDGEAHTKSTKKTRARLKQLSGITGWTAHDLRRTARTLMSRLKIKHHVRERVLNHSVGKMAGTYDRYDYADEKRAALQKLANEIDRIRGAAVKPAKVVRISKKVA